MKFLLFRFAMGRTSLGENLPVSFSERYSEVSDALMTRSQGKSRPREPKEGEPPNRTHRQANKLTHPNYPDRPRQTTSDAKDPSAPHAVIMMHPCRVKPDTRTGFCIIFTGCVAIMQRSCLGCSNFGAREKNIWMTLLLG